MLSIIICQFHCLLNHLSIQFIIIIIIKILHWVSLFIINLFSDVRLIKNQAKYFCFVFSLFNYIIVLIFVHLYTLNFIHLFASFNIFNLNNKLSHTDYLNFLIR